MLRSLRSRLILASVLWTAGLLMLMHIFMILVVHLMPGIRMSRPAGPTIVALALMCAGVLGLRHSLSPFRSLRQRLTAVRTGDAQRVDGIYPSEVQPLIDELNALLTDREKAVQRALATAGDLAHGLKTPLALLAREADCAAEAGNPDVADAISLQVDRMSRQVTYHLARARAAASGSAGTARCEVGPCAEALVRTLLKLYGNRTLHITSTISPELAARVQREDLDEMLGNLLDNACKWARSTIALEAVRTTASVTLMIEDDGPGLAPELRAKVLERGVRLDESAPGSGLGLAIVRDLAELYGGSIALDDSPLGGLRVRLTLPSL